MQGQTFKIGAKRLLRKNFLRVFEERDWHQDTRDDVLWVGQKFFFWLIQNGHDDLNKVGAEQVQKFVIFSSNTQRPSVVHNVKLYLKRLCDVCSETVY